MTGFPRSTKTSISQLKFVSDKDLGYLQVVFHPYLDTNTMKFCYMTVPSQNG